MPAPVIAAGFGLLAALGVAAFRLPAPRVSESAWVCAKTAVLPVSLVWLVSITVCDRPTAFAFAMMSGIGCCAVAWVMRAPPEERVLGPDDEGPWPRGGGDDPAPDDGGPHGGGEVDWDAFEREAFDAWRSAVGSHGRRQMPD
jgi:hypothetical protein